MISDFRYFFYIVTKNLSFNIISEFSYKLDQISLGMILDIIILIIMMLNYINTFLIFYTTTQYEWNFILYHQKNV